MLKKSQRNRQSGSNKSGLSKDVLGERKIDETCFEINDGLVFCRW